ncbi:PorT family protein [Flavobacterium sp. LS1R49]|uniref:PorT family protein n=1 Tax=Flavobacterium shii TaxID=2987687 RepID=A0A9X3C520_9FLAO|nr:porin family protein [Flavobacterium shii]MCV9929624.1 PorT family protein [Flavobacterium shii]
MKKIILIAFGILVGILNTQAQVTVNPGVKGGLNFSRLTNFEANGPKVDFNLGGYAAIKFNRLYTLQPEVNYSRQGVRSEYVNFFSPTPNYNNSRTKTYSLDYVSLSVINKFNFAGRPFYALVGPSLDFKVADNFSSYNRPVDFDFSIVGGVGYTLPNGLSFEARIKQGFLDIFGNDYFYKDSNNDYHYNDVVLNQVFQLGITYTFKVK